MSRAPFLVSPGAAGRSLLHQGTGTASAFPGAAGCVPHDSPLPCWGQGWRWLGMHPRSRGLPCERGSSCLPKLPLRLPAHQAAIFACHVISGIVFRTMRLGGGISFPRGCDEFAVGDLWQVVLASAVQGRGPSDSGKLLIVSVEKLILPQ